MRLAGPRSSRWLAATIVCCLSQVQLANALTEPTPTSTTMPALATFTQASHLNLFFRRQECPGGTIQCTGEGFNGVCCPASQVCDYDESNEPACCPSGAVCTGTAPDSPGDPPSETVSFVPNSYFPFPYIATELDQSECSSAVSQCSENYDTCVTELENGNQGGNGVTIVVPGADGTTVAGNAPSVGSSASPICSSLWSQGCRQLDTTDCEGPTTVNGVVIESSENAAQPTADCRIGMAVGVGVGFAVMEALR